MIMKLTFMRLDGSLRWFLDIPCLGYGVSYPVFYRGSFRFLLSLIFSRLFRREFDRHFGPSEADLKNAKSLQEWYDSLPPDPTKPSHDFLDS